MSIVYITNERLMQLPLQFREGHAIRDTVRDRGFRDWQSGNFNCPYDSLDPTIAFKLWYEGQKIAENYFNDFKLSGAL